MISALVNSLLPLSLLISLMLIIRQPLRQSIDATTVYNLWLVIPLSLLLYLTPLPWQDFSWFSINALTTNESANAVMQRYFVSPSLNLSQELSLDNVIGLWFCSTWALGFTLLVGYWTLSQHNYRKALKLTFLVNSKYSKNGSVFD